MATMDIIKLHGGKPANFLDIGGGASHEQIMEGIKLLENDNNVIAIFLNIFGGILKCDKVATSIIRATEEIQVTKPIVLRLKGTNSAEAMELFKGKEKEIGIYSNEDLDEAAKLVVKLSQPTL
jgi:succinyl-CoA synthetase beta subunit